MLFAKSGVLFVITPLEEIPVAAKQARERWYKKKNPKKSSPRHRGDKIIGALFYGLEKEKEARFRGLIFSIQVFHCQKETSS